MQGYELCVQFSVALKWADHSIWLDIIQNKRLSEAEPQLVNKTVFIWASSARTCGYFHKHIFLSLTFKKKNPCAQQQYFKIIWCRWCLEHAKARGGDITILQHKGGLMCRLTMKVRYLWKLRCNTKLIKCKKNAIWRLIVESRCTF